MEQVLTLPGEVERWAHYGTEYVKADDYAALNDYAALVQMERDMARAEVEAHKRSRQLDANEARSREQELRAEVELLKVDLDETIKDSHKQLAEVERLRAALQGLIVASDYYTDSAPYITALEAARAVLSPGAAHVDCPKCRTRLDPSDAVCFRCERPVDAMDGLARRKPSPKSEAAHK